MPSHGRSDIEWLKDEVLRHREAIDKLSSQRSFEKGVWVTVVFLLLCVVAKTGAIEHLLTLVSR
jgi:hypothetical protein